MDEDKILDMLKKDGEVKKWKVDWDMHDCVYEEYTESEYAFEAVQKVTQTLTEIQLREEHADLKQAWDEYYRLLEKYRFWNDVTK